MPPHTAKHQQLSRSRRTQACTTCLVHRHILLPGLRVGVRAAANVLLGCQPDGRRVAQQPGQLALPPARLLLLQRRRQALQRSGRLQRAALPLQRVVGAQQRQGRYHLILNPPYCFLLCGAEWIGGCIWRRRVAGRRRHRVMQARGPNCAELAGKAAWRPPRCPPARLPPRHPGPAPRRAAAAGRAAELPAPPPVPSARPPAEVHHLPGPRPRCPPPAPHGWRCAVRGGRVGHEKRGARGGSGQGAPRSRHARRCVLATAPVLKPLIPTYLLLLLVLVLLLLLCASLLLVAAVAHQRHLLLRLGGVPRGQNIPQLAVLLIRRLLKLDALHSDARRGGSCGRRGWLGSTGDAKGTQQPATAPACPQQQLQRRSWRHVCLHTHTRACRMPNCAATSPSSLSVPEPLPASPASSARASCRRRRKPSRWCSTPRALPRAKVRSRRSTANLQQGGEGMGQGKVENATRVHHEEQTLIVLVLCMRRQRARQAKAWSMLCAALRCLRRSRRVSCPRTYVSGGSGRACGRSRQTSEEVMRMAAGQPGGRPGCCSCCCCSASTTSNGGSWPARRHRLAGRRRRYGAAGKRHGAASVANRRRNARACRSQKQHPQT